MSLFHNHNFVSLPFRKQTDLERRIEELKRERERRRSSASSYEPPRTGVGDNNRESMLSDESSFRESFSSVDTFNDSSEKKRLSSLSGYSSWYSERSNSFLNDVPKRDEFEGESFYRALKELRAVELVFEVDSIRKHQNEMSQFTM